MPVSGEQANADNVVFFNPHSAARLDPEIHQVFLERCIKGEPFHVLLNYYEPSSAPCTPQPWPKEGSFP
jgi:hypothetical protein